MIGTIANIVKAVVGAGILSLSWSFYYSTMWPAVFFTTLMGSLSAQNFAMLGLCSDITGLHTYSEIWGRCFGERSSWLPDLVTMAYCFTSCASYLIVVGDYVPLGLSGLGIHWEPLQHRETAIICVSLLILPLNFLQDLSLLGYTSILGTFGGLYTCCVLVSEAAEFGMDASDWREFDLQPGLFVMIPTVAFSFTGHFNAPEVYQQLDRPSPKRWLTVTAVAFGICFLVTLACGMSGYIMFGSELSLPGRSNILTAPALQGKPEVMVAYIATTLSVTFSLPLYLQALRGAVESTLLRHSPAPIRTVCGGLSARARRFVLSAFCVTSTLATSLITNSLGLTNSINGALCACLMVFIFPSLMYLKCTEAREVSAMHRWLPWMSIILGAAVGLSGVVTSVLLAFGFDLGAAPTVSHPGRQW